MKSIFIAFDQAYYDRIITMLEKTIVAVLQHGMRFRVVAAKPANRTTDPMHGHQWLMP